MTPPLAVSAIVPVYNPGNRIDRCIETLVGQSLPRDRYEVIFVDDGSTDATPERLDRLAAEHPHVRVEHIPNSGWPGRPRNVGIDMARGEYVFFVDNDDHLGEEALERLHERAVSAEADVVMGKVVGHGRPVPRVLFTENRDGVTLEWPPLVRLLAPHKLFRKALLDEHGIRFPEGRRRLEDHVFTMHAYFHAERVSILADYPCYHWVRHGDEAANASHQGLDPVGYYGNVREVLDLVAEHTEPGEFRDRLLAHWYRGKMLGRMGGSSFANRPPDARRALYDEVRALARERYGDGVDRFLSRSLRVRSHLLREGTYDDLLALARWEAGLHAELTIDDTRFDADGTFVLSFAARLLGPRDAPLRFERRDGRLLWDPPEDLPGTVPAALLDWTDAFPHAQARVVMRSVSDRTDFVLPAEQELELVDAGAGRVTPVMRGEARIEPRRAAAGATPPPGRWEVLGVVRVGGFATAGRARRRLTADEYEVRIGEDGAVAGPGRPRPAGVLRGLARRVPGLADAVRRSRRAAPRLP